LGPNSKEPALEAASPPETALFSYGTLRQANVQRAIFGRLLEGRPDALRGWALAPLEIRDPEVVAISAAAVHQMARLTGDPEDVVPGVVFELTPAELEAADRYEVEEMTRIRVRLASGSQAWIYVSAAG
jgi:gamma-glutamylcyclotransferase (GGCT)/AIG2-like uncharacterized protein YtfP